MLPRVKVVAALLNMGNSSLPEDWEALRRVGSALGFRAVLGDIRRREDISRAFEAFRAEGVEAVSVSTDTVTQANRELIVQAATAARLPALYVAREFIDAGGLMTYGVDYSDLYRRAAGYVSRIFRGANPGVLPIETPVKFQMIVNLGAARAIGLEFPTSIISQADDVVD